MHMGFSGAVNSGLFVIVCQTAAFIMVGFDISACQNAVCWFSCPHAQTLLKIARL